ncbi:MAG: gliding motility-associated C-terminal domain-containing protein [Bacteroidota bacterium]
MRAIFTLVILLLYSLSVWAQPSNDDCNSPIPISNVNGCSEFGAYSNVGATPSGYDAADCFSGAHNDVWFSFVALATTVTVTVSGVTRVGADGGTLQNPEAAMYEGDCETGGEINEMRCESDTRNGIVEFNRGGLIIGQTYYIRVQGRNGGIGTFQLCINNFNPPVDPGQDCNDAAVLCNKESFAVQKVFGGGNDPSEANGAPCFFTGSSQDIESSSTWFVWTAENDGSLTFTITPLNISDDLDFIVYELPNGVGDCSAKTILRCMASGTDPNAYPSRCLGPTGLSSFDTDISEPAGCQDAAQNNFLAPLDMIQGRTYGLFINNFSDTGSGFEISFGGTGEFVGPEAAFTTDEADSEICLSETITFSDASTFAFGNIIAWEWGFGVGASPATANSQEGIEVTYSTPGIKSIALTVTTTQGCKVTTIQTINVTCCPDQFDVLSTLGDVSCPSGGDGSIALDVNNSFLPLQYNWSNGSLSEDIQNLPAGNYFVTISDVASCDTVLNYFITQPDTVALDTLLRRPTCGGGSDGTLTFIVNGGTAPFEYNFDNRGFSDSDFYDELEVDDYDLQIRDDNGCLYDYTLPVRELEIILDPNVNAVTPPSCNGFSDGKIDLVVANGLPPYQFAWDDEQGFLDENAILQLQAGTYEVVILDDNLCRGEFIFNMEDYPPVEVNFDILDASCNGESDGIVTALAQGGVGNYTYAWDIGGNTVSKDGLSAGAYMITVQDGNNCQLAATAIVNEPGILDVEPSDITNVLCFGDSTGNVTLQAIGGNPPFLYSIDGAFFQPSPTLTGLPEGSYNARIEDARGCRDSVNFIVTQPSQLLVDAGEDQSIGLGGSTSLLATPNEINVTYSWSSNPMDSIGCINCPDPMVSPVVPTTYFIQVLNGSNCEAIDSVRVFVDNSRPVYIPNVFSPNRDGNNDRFTIYGGVAIAEVRTMNIFDRWGNLVYSARNFQAGDESRGWNGRFNGEEAGAGTYVYFIEIAFINNTTLTFKGDFVLLR